MGHIKYCGVSDLTRGSRVWYIEASLLQSQNQVCEQENKWKMLSALKDRGWTLLSWREEAVFKLAYFIKEKKTVSAFIVNAKGFMCFSVLDNWLVTFWIFRHSLIDGQ